MLSGGSWRVAEYWFVGPVWKTGDPARGLGVQFPCLPLLFYGCVAQLVGHWIPNPAIGGSSPSAPALGELGNGKPKRL